MTRPAWIKTTHDCPPIPYRGMDWCAYDDRLGADASPYGYGRTEDEAIADLMADFTACERCAELIPSEHLNIHGNCEVCAEDLGQ